MYAPNLFKIGIECGARLIAFEKPVALTSMEGMQVKKMLAESGVKAVVSHQHRYGVHYRKVKEIISGGQLGRVHTVYGTATGWMMHMLSHLIDYMRWYNNNEEAEMGRRPGRGQRKVQGPPSLAGLHCRADSVPERRARRGRVRRGRARRSRGRLLVAQVPDRRSGR